VKYALLVVMLAACKEKDEPSAEHTRGVEPERPEPERRVAKPVSIDHLLRSARDKAGPDQTPWRIAIDNVAADGTIDPASGEVQVWFGAPASREPGDPQHPTGTPIKPVQPKVRPKLCNQLTWREGIWSDMGAGCTENAGSLAVRCSVPVIWERAIAKGAPRDAVAKLEIHAADQPQWELRIDDSERGVHFHSSFPDDCDTTR
jgi:hypothetical protein